MDFADKVLISNYDYPMASEGGVIPVAPLKWIRQNFDYYCEIYSRAKLVPKLIMVNTDRYRLCHFTATTSPSTVSTNRWKPWTFWRS